MRCLLRKKPKAVCIPGSVLDSKAMCVCKAWHSPNSPSQHQKEGVVDTYMYGRHHLDVLFYPQKTTFVALGPLSTWSSCPSET